MLRLHTGALARISRVFNTAPGGILLYHAAAACRIPRARALLSWAREMTARCRLGGWQRLPIMVVGIA